ncbi:uncharacterized protein ACNS7B_017278 [Menidia menidia]
MEDDGVKRDGVSLAEQLRQKEKSVVYEERNTVIVEMKGGEAVTAMELMKTIRELCGAIAACRFLADRKYEVTMVTDTGKRRLLDGCRIGETVLHTRELTSDEMVVSFLAMPAYIGDEAVIAKLAAWKVEAVSVVKRRMWPGTQVADGTRYVKVKFNKTVQSLPYSTKFDTAAGPEYIRVIHDRQARVCRLCLQPGHIVRECPEFKCYRCGAQGHLARECKKPRQCALCYNAATNCICNEASQESDGGENNEDVAGGDRQSADEDGGEIGATAQEGGGAATQERAAPAVPPPEPESDVAGETPATRLEGAALPVLRLSGQGEVETAGVSGLPAPGGADSGRGIPVAASRGSGQPPSDEPGSDSDMDLETAKILRKRPSLGNRLPRKKRISKEAASKVIG